MTSYPQGPAPWIDEDRDDDAFLRRVVENSDRPVERAFSTALAAGQPFCFMLARDDDDGTEVVHVWRTSSNQSTLLAWARLRAILKDRGLLIDEWTSDGLGGYRHLRFDLP